LAVHEARVEEPGGSTGHGVVCKFDSVAGLVNDGIATRHLDERVARDMLKLDGHPVDDWTSLTGAQESLIILLLLYGTLQKLFNFVFNSANLLQLDCLIVFFVRCLFREHN